MSKDRFYFKSECELIIKSDEISPDIITNEIGIVPHRSFIKGERSVSKASGSIMVKPHNLWAIKSNPTKLYDESIMHHIEHFRSVLSTKTNNLIKYKQDPRFDVVFWFFVTTDNSGIGLDFNSIDLEFLNNLSNRTHFSLVCNIQE
jgi:hypothetical protein